MKEKFGPGIECVEACQKLTDEEPPQKYRNSVKEKNQKPPESPAPPGPPARPAPQAQPQGQRPLIDNQAQRRQEAADWNAMIDRAKAMGIKYAENY